MNQSGRRRRRRSIAFVDGSVILEQLHFCAAKIATCCVGANSLPEQRGHCSFNV